MNLGTRLKQATMIVCLQFGYGFFDFIRLPIGCQLRSFHVSQSPLFLTQATIKINKLPLKRRKLLSDVGEILIYCS